MMFTIFVFVLYTRNYVYAVYSNNTFDATPIETRVATPTVQDIVGRLSESASEPEVAARETSPLFPSAAARQEARRRSYGSSGDFNAIYPTKAALVEARRRALGTTSSVDSLVTSQDAAMLTKSDEVSVTSQTCDRPVKTWRRGKARKSITFGVNVHGTVSEESEHDVTSSC